MEPSSSLVGALWSCLFVGPEYRPEKRVLTENEGFGCVVGIELAKSEHEFGEMLVPA